MNGDMRRVGDQPTLRIEDRAGEIQPLADVHRRGAALKRRAHFLGNTHEQPGEYLQPDGIDRFLRRLFAPRRDPFEQQRTLAQYARGPAGLDHHGRHRIDDE